ncbi:hypothetical protein CASFOL_016081 [Castilleja foliolosa]|uniref:Uncharacterized protein n=1 Tax=Castilleja foliolosa TaxID=1961234 RepID=A0ABD3DFK4_9LAMI
MNKSILRTNSFAHSKYRLLCIATLIGAVVIFSALWFNFKEPKFSSLFPNPNIIESPEKTFYDDPEIYYTIDKPMFNWDEKRRNWLKNHPNLGSKNGVIVVTGSQPSPCKNPSGDHFLLRLFKNKVDYCRIHRYKIFYNNGFFEPKMRSFWAKIPILRAAMLAHPEMEWLFWVDSDAIFTDMEFKVPFERYEDHNMVVHGWPNMIYQDKSWVAVNAGVFLIRNCQWAMEFLDVWASMGPKSPDFIKWGKILRETLKDKMFPESDDQSALVYLLLKGDKKWTDKIYVENEYFLHGYWLGFADKFDEIENKYLEMEKRVKKLRRAHAEVASESYAAKREWVGDGKRPFVTHFTGCQPCSGDNNLEYKGNSCTVGMERALNFADNQVLRNYGFVHPDIENGSFLLPLSFR